jgi:hypothetical protein
MELYFGIQLNTPIAFDQITTILTHGCPWNQFFWFLAGGIESWVLPRKSALYCTSRARTTSRNHNSSI